jgi:Na+-translocating ferredoxin:NAD+ oxidoreductase RnfE subunit
VGRSKKAIDIRLMFAYDQCVRNALYLPFVFGLCPTLAATNAALIIGIGW